MSQRLWDFRIHAYLSFQFFCWAKYLTFAESQPWMTINLREATISKGLYPTVNRVRERVT